MQRPTKWSLEVRGAPLEAVTLLERIPRLLRFRLAGREDRLMVRLARRLGFPESASLELTVGEAEPRLRAYLGPAPARWRRHLPLERAGLLGLAQHPVARTLDGAVEPAASRLLQALRLERLTVLPLGCFDEGWRLLLLADGPRLAPDVLAGLRDAARVIVDAARLQQEAANPVATGSVPARTVSPGEGPRAAAAVADLPPMGAGGEEGRPSSGGDAGERRLVEKQRELLANVSHDLKNPLAAVSTSLQVLESGRAGEMNPTQRRLLGLARRNCDRLLKMVHELVDGERRAEAESILKRRSFDPLPLLRAAMADSEEVASQMHRTLAWVGDHGSKLWGDPEHFRRILDNLVDNALKFGGEDGHVLVTLRKDQLRQTDEIGRAAAALGLQVWGSVLQVEDDGPGFSEEARRRAFERFWQAEEERDRGRGSGLGLSIVHSLVHAHQGWVHLDSEEGRGTSVGVWLPASEEDARLCGVLQSLVRELHRHRSRGRSPRLILMQARAAETEYLAGLSRLCEKVSESGGTKWSVHRIHPMAAAVLLRDEETPEPIERLLALQQTGREGLAPPSPDMSSSRSALQVGEARFPEDGATLDALFHHARRTSIGDGSAAAAQGAALSEVRT